MILELFSWMTKGNLMLLMSDHNVCARARACIPMHWYMNSLQSCACCKTKKRDGGGEISGFNYYLDFRSEGHSQIASVFFLFPAPFPLTLHSIKKWTVQEEGRTWLLHSSFTSYHHQKMVVWHLQSEICGASSTAKNLSWEARRFPKDK